MELNQLREFILLAEIGSFSEVSEILFISQSSLSRHLQALEAELNTALLIRTTRHVEVNEYGELFLPYAKSIVDSYDKFKDILTIKLNKGCAELRIGSIPSMIEYNIIDALTSFQQNYPMVKLKFIEGDSHELKGMLQQDFCDIAFVRGNPGSNSEFVSIPYTVDRLVAVLPTFHPLAHSDSIELEKLKDDNFLMLPRNNSTHQLCVKQCRKAGFEPRVEFISNSLANIIDLVSKGMGVSLLTKKAIKPIINMTNANICVMDIMPAVSTTINLLYAKRKELSPYTYKFISHVKTMRRANKTI